MLPGADGLTVCRTVRPQYSGPILMLTSMSDDIDEVAGLETGAVRAIIRGCSAELAIAMI